MTTYVRVKDLETRHEFDVPEGDKRIGVSLELVKSKRYPPSPWQRPAKHHIDLAGHVSREPAAATAVPETATTKES
ncbi:hypothetical protein [Cellulomonas gilvus]|uniref:Uncharacterized protein n=1 Tax=Cellulomonas gilvus (strain ATCC 13127 / NRRL B-14078) TaxID=593907 RepID=F8A2F9_CELGA|nr:hypothetical protein [Cellulomonas gilvus]AEI11816.1 hypothetical protein Celgi_1297 [Cellulomonas gilvus ATCC 13127]